MTLSATASPALECSSNAMMPVEVGEHAVNPGQHHVGGHADVVTFSVNNNEQLLADTLDSQ